MVHEVFYLFRVGRGDVYGVAPAFHLRFSIIPGIVNAGLPAKQDAIVL
jgi:hypothetical protein